MAGLIARPRQQPTGEDRSGPRADRMLPAMLARRRTTPTLLVSELYGPGLGGSATWFREVYRRYAAGTALILAGGPDGAEDTGGGSWVHRTPMRAADWGFLSAGQARYYARLALVAYRLRRRYDIGMVHCGRVIPEGVVGWMLHRLTGAPYCVYAHGEEIGTASSSSQLAFLMRRVYSSALWVISNSENTRSLLRDEGVSDSRIAVIHPGVDVERFQPSASSKARARLGFDHRRVLLTVGRLQRRKGHDTVLRALPTIAQAAPDIHYVVAGAGEEEARLRALADELGVAKLVTFAGRVSEADLPAYYQACDVFVMPNREEANADLEGFGIVFLEAAACGKPTVGGRSGGVAEAIVDGETGLLVDGRDANSVASTVLRLLLNPVHAEAMGRRGRERAIREFSWDTIAARIQRLEPLTMPTTVRK